MTRIDFYVLSNNDLMERLQLICKLSEKAIGQAQKVFIHSDSEEELKQLDHTLWDFRPISFVPHKLHMSFFIKPEPQQLCHICLYWFQFFLAEADMPLNYQARIQELLKAQVPMKRPLLYCSRPSSDFVA